MDSRAADSLVEAEAGVGRSQGGELYQNTRESLRKQRRGWGSSQYCYCYLINMAQALQQLPLEWSVLYDASSCAGA